MKTKTIKTVLRKKFDEFVASIEDKAVAKLVKNNSIITGGCIASMYLQEPVNDYDIYFTNKETVLAVCNYFVGKFKAKKDKFYIIHIIDTSEEEGYQDEDRILIRIKSAGIAESKYIKDSVDEEKDGEIKIKNSAKKYTPIFISSNAITLSGKIQLIIRFYGSAEEIHKNYDFEHCTCYWQSKDGKLVTPSGALQCLLSKELRYMGSKYPFASIIRSRKFIRRGFSINAGQYLKMALQLNKIDLGNLEVLEDQLMGVDALYFYNMLSKIPEDKKIDGNIEYTYLMEMINRFF